MEEVILAAETRVDTGSAASRRLRLAGKVPAVLYGHGIDPQALTVDGRELRGALGHEAGLNALISLDVGSAGRHLALARQLQRHPVRGTVDHVDFLVVRRDEVVSAEVPVRLVGEALEVHRGDGLVEQQLFTLVVHATPADIPSAIEVDVTNLTIGDAVRVRDLVMPARVRTDIDPEESVVAGQASRVAAEMEEVAAAEAEEAAAAAPQPGAEEPAAEDEGADGS